MNLGLPWLLWKSQSFMKCLLLLKHIQVSTHRLLLKFNSNRFLLVFPRRITQTTPSSLKSKRSLERSGSIRHPNEGFFVTKQFAENNDKEDHLLKPDLETSETPKTTHKKLKDSKKKNLDKLKKEIPASLVEAFPMALVSL